MARQLTTRPVALTHAPSIVISDDQCIERLAWLIERRDDSRLEEIAALIARLVVPIE
jgi:hypothetical protein